MLSSTSTTRSPIAYLQNEVNKPDYALPPKSSMPSLACRCLAQLYPRSGFAADVRLRVASYKATHDLAVLNRDEWWSEFEGVTDSRYPLADLLGKCTSNRERSLANRFVKTMTPARRNTLPTGVWQDGAALMTGLVSRCDMQDRKALESARAERSGLAASDFLAHARRGVGPSTELGVVAEDVPAVARAIFTATMQTRETVRLAGDVYLAVGSNAHQRVNAVTYKALWGKFQKRLDIDLERRKVDAARQDTEAFADGEGVARSTPTASEIQALVDQVIADELVLAYRPVVESDFKSVSFPASTERVPGADIPLTPAMQPKPIKTSIVVRGPSRKTLADQFEIPTPPLFSRMVAQVSDKEKLKQYGDWLEKVHLRLHALAGTVTHAGLEHALFDGQQLSAGLMNDVSHFLTADGAALTVADFPTLERRFDLLLGVVDGSALLPKRDRAPDRRVSWLVGETPAGLREH